MRVAVGQSRGSRAGDKRTDGSVGRHRCHGKHHAAHASSANEIFLFRGEAALCVLTFAEQNSDSHIQNQIADKDTEDNDLILRHITFPPFHHRIRSQRRLSSAEMRRRRAPEQSCQALIR